MPAPVRQLLTAKKRAALLAALTLGLLLVTSFVGLHEWLVGFLPEAEAMVRSRPVLGVSVFVLFAALSAMLAFVSSAVIVPVGVYTWGKLVSMLLLIAGWVLGGIGAYVVGRYLGRTAVNALAPAAGLDRYEASLSRKAPFGLVLLFQIAMPSEIPAYLLGLLRYPFWKFACALVLAELPYSAATVYLGEGFLRRQIALMAGVGTLLVLFSAWALHMLNRRFRHERRRASRPPLAEPSRPAGAPHGE